MQPQFLGQHLSYLKRLFLYWKKIKFWTSILFVTFNGTKDDGNLNLSRSLLLFSALSRLLLCGGRKTGKEGSSENTLVES